MTYLNPWYSTGTAVAEAEGTGEEAAQESEKRPTSDSGQELDRQSDAASAEGNAEHTPSGSYNVCENAC